MVKTEKKQLLTRHRFAVLCAKSKHFILLKDEDEVKRWLECNELLDGDIVVELKEEYTRLAVLKHFIELQ